MENVYEISGRAPKSAPRQSGSSRTAILDAAEALMSVHGYNGVSMRAIAREAGVNLGSVGYHFGTKENLLAAIYARHTRPMNQRRLELLAEAERISDRDERLTAIVRAFVMPAFSSRSDVAGGGARFTRLRAILSMEGNEAAKAIIAEAFDATSHDFVDAISRCVPAAARNDIVWRCHFLLGGLYYTLVNSERVARLTGDKSAEGSYEHAIDQLVGATTASLRDLAIPIRSGNF